MNENTICTDFPKIRKAPWINELKRNNISLTYLEKDDDSNKAIDILIGADIAGKLFTGKKHDLRSNLSAFETKLGWVIMGTLSELSMFLSEEIFSDLWKLDVIGITDPIEQADRITNEQRVKENFLSTVSLNENGRYTVDLPRVDYHPPLSRNLEVAKNRLNSTVKRLNKDGLYGEYNNIFSEWLEQGIIECVPDNELKNPAHYLSHRHVVKLGSTTPVRPVFDASASEKG